MSDTDPSNDRINAFDAYEIKLVKPDYKLDTYEFWATRDFVKLCIENEESRLNKYLKTTSRWKDVSQQTAVLKIGLTKNFDDENSKFALLTTNFNGDLEVSEEISLERKEDCDLNSFSRMKIILKSSLKKKILIGTAIGVGVIGLSTAAFFAAPVVLGAVGLGSAASAAAGAVAAVEGAAVATVAVGAAAGSAVAEVSAPVVAVASSSVGTSVGKSVFNFTKGKVQDLALETAWSETKKLFKKQMSEELVLSITDGSEIQEKQAEERLEKVREMTTKKAYKDWGPTQVSE